MGMRYVVMKTMSLSILIQVSLARKGDGRAEGWSVERRCTEGQRGTTKIKTKLLSQLAKRRRRKAAKSQTVVCYLKLEERSRPVQGQVASDRVYVGVAATIRFTIHLFSSSTLVSHTRREQDAVVSGFQLARKRSCCRETRGGGG